MQLINAIQRECSLADYRWYKDKNKDKGSTQRNGRTGSGSTSGRNYAIPCFEIFSLVCGDPQQGVFS